MTTSSDLHRDALTVRERVFNLCYPLWHGSSFVKRRKAHRLRRILKLIDFDLQSGGKLLDVGCADGKDMVSLLAGSNTSVYGLDIKDYGIRQDGFTFINADASAIPFPDKYFDATVSIGVLEHIEPIQKLLAVTREIDRVSKSYAVVMPAISTLLEPHTLSLLWQLRQRGRKSAMPMLNYFSDEAWLQFDGFLGADAQRFYYIPPIISNIVVYRRK